MPTHICQLLHSEAMKYHYPRLMFAIKAMAFLAILACIIYLMGLAEVSLAWQMGFSIIFVITIFIAFITPMLTRHEINNDGITIRQGAIFNTCFHFHLVDKVELQSSSTGLFGQVSGRGKIVLATGNKNMVRIKLNHKKRFGMMLMRKADEIIIDLEKPEEFVNLANEHLDV